MKKHNKIISLLLVFISFILILTGCGKEVLAKPTNLKINYTTATLSWDMVNDASEYIIDCGTKKLKSSKASFDLSILELGEYDIKIQAKNSKVESEWSDVIHYSRGNSSLLNLRLFNQNKEYEVIGLGMVSDSSIIIPASYDNIPITQIADNAFEGYANLEEVTLGNNIKSIGKSAFKGCTELKSIILNDGLIEIKPYAFQGCLSLDNVAMPASVLSVGEFAFSYCKSLTNLALSNSLTEIPNNMLADCNRLNKIIIPSMVKTIGDYAFAANRSLKEVKLGDGLESIGKYAFFDCKEIKSINTGASLKLIDDFAFQGCSSLKDVRLNDGLIKIGAQAFYDTTSLEAINIPNSVSYIGDYAFMNSRIYNELADEVYIDSWLIAIKNVNGEALAIKDGTRGIANLAIKELPGVKSIVLSKDLVYIGDYNIYKMDDLISLDFNGCSLKEIGAYSIFDCKGLLIKELPASLEEIHKNALGKTLNWSTAGGIVTAGDWVIGHKNNQAMDVVLPSGIKGVSDYAFNNFKNLKVARLNSGLEIIGEGAFNGCRALQEVELSDSITRIGAYAFASCGALEKIKLPANLKRIEKSTFYMDSRLKEVDLNEGLEYIGEYAFYQTGIIRLNIPASVKIIDECAFYSISSLQVLNLNEGLERIEAYAFSRSINLDELALPNSLSYIGEYAFYGNILLNNIVLGEGVKEIGAYAFYNAVLLNHISLNEGLEKIGSYAFGECKSLTNLDIPKSLKAIDSYAFIGCKSLGSVYLNNNIEYIGSYAFASNNEISFYIEEGTKYENWSGCWNSSYRPIIANAQFKDGYLYSFTMNKENALNLETINGLQAPFRDGYKFIGWSKSINSSEIYLTLDQTKDIPEGMLVYALWEKM